MPRYAFDEGETPWPVWSSGIADVIRRMRRYYQVAPDARFVIRHIEERRGPGSRNRLFELFPYGYPGQACRIAGMKRPRAWSTG